jgi:hypothetical protein
VRDAAAAADAEAAESPPVHASPAVPRPI